MYNFTQRGPFDERQIETLRQHLVQMDQAALTRFYNSSLHMCMLSRNQPPRASFVQQLVQAWKEMIRRAQVSTETGPNVGIPAAFPGIDKEQPPPQKRLRASKTAKAEEDALLSTMSLFAGNPAGTGNRLNSVNLPG